MGFISPTTTKQVHQSNPVLKSSAKKDWDQSLSTRRWSGSGGVGEEGVRGVLHIPLRCISKARGRETFGAYICVCVSVCVAVMHVCACVCFVCVCTNMTSLLTGWRLLLATVVTR